MKEKAVWLRKMEQTVGPVKEAYDYVDAESGEYAYTHLLLESGEDRSCWKRSEEYAKQGYGGYYDYPVYSPDFQAIRPANRVYLCQRERDARAMYGIGVPALCLYKASVPKKPEHIRKFRELVKDKEVVVCPSGDRESDGWKRKITKNILDGREYFVMDEGTDIENLIAAGKDEVEKHVKNCVVPSANSSSIPSASGYGLGLIRDGKPISLQRNVNGTVAQTRLNALEILTKDPEFRKLKIRYNKLSEQMEIEGMPHNPAPHEVDSEDVLNIMTRMETYGFNSKDNLFDALGVIANGNRYHPIIEYLESLPDWDGKDRYADFLPRYLGAARNELVKETTKMMLTSAVKRVYEPGSKYDICVVFIGKQGIGKSTLCNKLAHGEKYFADGLKDFDKKAYETIRGKWIVEMAEMKATLSAKSAEEVKQFLGAKQDRHRDLYERLAKDRPRQCIFIGTANNTECLPYDESGNRRFIPIDCEKSRQEVHPLADGNIQEYIDQLWAQALDDYRNGNAVSNLDMKYEEMLKANADAHMTQDPRAGVIQDYLDSLTEGKVCILQIWKDALKEDGFPEKKDSRELGNLLDNKIDGWKNTGKTATFKKFGKKCKYWVRVEFNERDLEQIRMMHGKEEDYMLLDGELRKKDGTKAKQMTTDEWEKKLKEPGSGEIVPGDLVDTPDGRGIVFSVKKMNGGNVMTIFFIADSHFSDLPERYVKGAGQRADLTKLGEILARLSGFCR